MMYFNDCAYMGDAYNLCYAVERSCPICSLELNNIFMSPFPRIQNCSVHENIPSDAFSILSGTF